MHEIKSKANRHQTEMYELIQKSDRNQIEINYKSNRNYRNPIEIKYKSNRNRIEIKQTCMNKKQIKQESILKKNKYKSYRS